MKLVIRFLALIFSIALTACGAGSSNSNKDNAVVSFTAKQYFTKTAVGNTWKYSNTDTYAPTGMPNKTTTDIEDAEIKVTSLINGGVNINRTSIINGNSSVSTYKRYIDASGRLILDDGIVIVELPATFTVGTNWIDEPADIPNGTGASTAKIIAFNVKHAVGNMTFTDCLQVETMQNNPDGTFSSAVIYISPTVGNIVEYIESYSYLDATNGNGSGVLTKQLQSYTIK